jgi:hypothetical protein
MKKSLATVLLASLVSLATTGASHAAAAEKQPAAKPRPGESILVRWQVELSGGVRARLMAVSGDMVQVTRPDGTTVGMTPRVGKTEDTSRSVTFEIYEVFGDPRKEKQTFRHVDTVEASVDQVVLSPKVTDLSLTLRAIERPKPESAPPTKKAPESTGPHVVRWSVILPDGRWIKMVAVEGDTASLRLADGRSYGLQPTVTDEGRVTFRILGGERTKVLGDSTSSHLLERFTLEPGAEYFPATLADSLLQIADVREVSRDELRKMRLELPKDEIEAACCVTCGATRACACGVSMDCGDCCVPPCCAWMN